MPTTTVDERKPSNVEPTRKGKGYPGDTMNRRLREDCRRRRCGAIEDVDDPPLGCRDRLFHCNADDDAARFAASGALSRGEDRDPIHSSDRREFLGSGAAAALTLAIASTAATARPRPADAIDLPHVDAPSLKIPSPVRDYRFFVAGGLCAAASHGATTPIDVVKTRIQSTPEEFADVGLLSAASRVWETDGPKGLLAGLGPTVAGYGLEGSVKFGLYESLKPTFAGLLMTEEVSKAGGLGDAKAVAYLGASVVAGAAASLLLCPMERTRIRLVTDPNFATGLLTGLPRLIEEEGLPYIFSGMPAMLSKQVPYTITKQVTFDLFASSLYAAAATYGFAQSEIKLEVSVFAAFLASILSCITSHPGDVVLTATYKGDRPDDRSGFGRVVGDIYEERGIGGFFTGISARFVHVGAIITSQLVLYDIIKQLLGLPATGSH